MIVSCVFIPHPSGDLHEKHYITGEEIVQRDYIIVNPVKTT
jgi:hypothetical protein